jgi:hypothetical protein
MYAVPLSKIFTKLFIFCRKACKFPGTGSKLFFLCVLFAFNVSLAQIISTGLNESKSLVIVYNADFIKANKIKYINKHISDKPDNEVITDKGLIEHAEFDKEGRMISSYTTTIKKTTVKEIPSYTYNRHGQKIPYNKIEYSYLYDSTFAFYKYDSLGRIVIRRNSIIGREVFKSYYYEYDDKGNVKKEVVLRELNNAENAQNFNPGIQTVLSLESFSYEGIGPGQVRKTFFNDEGRIYKTGIVYRDKKGHISEEAFDFTVTWIKEHNFYLYNDKDLLIQKKLSSNEGLSENESYQYESNGNGILTGLTLFRDNIKINEISYLYDKTNQFLQSEVNRDFRKSTIGITRYEYVFF